VILVLLITLLFVGGIAAWLSEYVDSRLPRIITGLTLIIDLLLMLTLLAAEPHSLAGAQGQWLAHVKVAWMPRLGVDFQLGVDGLGLLMLLLTGFLGIMALGAAWDEITERPGFFYFNMLWTLAGVLGVFMALDLLLFFFFWEVMLVPMYLIIAIWGHENKNYAAMKFFIFTQVTGLLMLIAIGVLAYVHYVQFGRFSFDYFALFNVRLGPQLEMVVMLGFFLAFATKLPSVPLHAWLPDAHSQAPTPGSVILAGVLLKTGAYGLLRFTLPLFPNAAAQFAPVAMTLAAISIVYCAKVAFAQTDIKRLIAYTSVSHMGFVMLGIFAWNVQAVQGAVMTMLAHGLSAAALFMLAGGLQHRIHTRNMAHMGGFWSVAPLMAVTALFFSVAALGMPGLGNFVGEFLALIGAFQANHALTIVAALGLVLAAVYSLWVLQKVFQGAWHSVGFESGQLTDLNRRELLYYGAMMVGLVWMGMYPQSFLALSAQTLQTLLPGVQP
jgi:NADH-quinone oxidoreductase subunit M